jgi:hypothetical protein
MSMQPVRFPIAVIVQRTPLENRWISERWEPVAAELDSDAPTARTHVPVPLADGGAGTRWRFAGCAIELHRSEAEGYFLNLTSPDPKIFVMWRRADEGVVPAIRPEIATVSYNEAARLMDGGEQVDAVPMLPEILAWMRPFVAEHYKPEPKRKVKRNDPFADKAAGRGRERAR